MSGGRVTGRVAGAVVAGVLLIPLAVVLAFWRPQQGQWGHDLLGVLTWGGLRFVEWAALAGGTWLLAWAWQSWRGTGGRADDEGPLPQEG
jgi:hypothetical protein